MNGTTITIKMAGGSERTFRFEGRATRLDFRSLFIKNKKNSDGKCASANYYMDANNHTMVVEDQSLFDKIIGFLDKINTNKNNDIKDNKTNKTVTLIDDSDITNVNDPGLVHYKPDEEENSGRIVDKKNNFYLDYAAEFGW